MVSSLHWSQFIFLALLMGEIAAATPPAAKPGCPSRCGNVDIPYPFGMGANKSCYFDEWFKIDCNTTSNSTRAFLGKINLEVLNFYYENFTVRVNSPIISSKYCTGGKTGRAVNLIGSPFSYADEKNSFFALGCSNPFLLTFTKTDLVGLYKNPCLGRDCYQVTIRSPLQEFNLSFVDDNEKGRERCRRAFMVENEWILSKVEDPYEKVRDRYYVPVILEWSMSLSIMPMLKVLACFDTGLSNASFADCAKRDPEVSEDTEKNFAELLTEELKLREAESLENQQRADMALLEAKKMTSQYQKEADKCNSGMETCEEAREKAEAALAVQKKLTAMWESRARQRGWKEGITRSRAQSQGNVESM
ncbi:hypothetical protein GH714_028159 [Hevea brasiliensis]|uniref:Wall-associated receptor kinase galacturonan-binding domain-containing protein n=1 Tax=Hevea brasiliensis TaxID=3981 RepID=A0A6A6LMD0_HEVBR|nr:hypothetical protein GH714_028159 [Hevea brasiliensis]